MNGSKAKTLKREPTELQSIQEMKDNIRRMKENPYRRRIEEAGQRYLKSRKASQSVDTVEPTMPNHISESQEEIQIVGCLSLSMIAKKNNHR